MRLFILQGLPQDTKNTTENCEIKPCVACQRQRFHFNHFRLLSLKQLDKTNYIGTMDLWEKNVVLLCLRNKCLQRLQYVMCYQM